MAFPPSLGGAQVFGLACNVSYVPNANATQVAAFFGVAGVQSMDGGSRGAAFEIQGCMVGINPAGVQFYASSLLSMADGVARTFIDTTGVAWASCVFRREFQYTGGYALLCDGTGRWIRPYRAVIHQLQ